MVETTLFFVENMSYAKSEIIINRLQHREDIEKIRQRTLEDCITRWGESIHEDQVKQSLQALSDNGFDPDLIKPRNGETISKSITDPAIPKDVSDKIMDKYSEIINSYSETHENLPDIGAQSLLSLECPDFAVILMIDDISVKRQNERRKINNKKGYKSAKTVINTVIWLRSKEGLYAITAGDTKEGLKIALGFMLKNHLLENRQLIIFFDGARSIRNNVHEIFSFHKPLKMYLDWYHVCRRISENLSMALKCGRENRDKNQDIIKKILSKIWFNKVDDAIAVLQSIDNRIVRQINKIQDSIDYLENRRPYLYNYASRKIVGLINSSNRVEDMNKQLVATRQKNSGMSWSVSGSHGLANVTMLTVNGEMHSWISQKSVRFSPRIQPAAFCTHEALPQAV